MSRIQRYVADVMEEIPLADPERERIARDLKAHLAETVEATGDEAEAVRRMGSPEDVARGYLEEAPSEVASVPSRVLAFLVDVALGLVVLLVVGGTLASLLLMSRAIEQGAPGTVPVAVIMLFIATISLLSIAYFPLMEWRLGQTLGKKLVGIHVVREDGRSIGLGQAIVRRIPFFLEFFWIDAIVALFTERKQRAFDLVARTMVTRTRRATSAATVASGVEQRA